jgi:hypothetical protein
MATKRKANDDETKEKKKRTPRKTKKSKKDEEEDDMDALVGSIETSVPDEFGFSASGYDVAPKILKTMMTSGEAKAAMDPSKVVSRSVTIHTGYVVVGHITKERESPRHLMINPACPGPWQKHVLRSLLATKQPVTSISKWDAAVSLETIKAVLEDPLGEYATMHLKWPAIYEKAADFMISDKSDPPPPPKAGEKKKNDPVVPVIHYINDIIFAYILEGIVQCVNYFVLNCSPLVRNDTQRAVIEDITTAKTIMKKEEKKTKTKKGSTPASKPQCIFTSSGLKAKKPVTIVITHNLNNPRRTKSRKGADISRTVVVNAPLQTALMALWYLNNWNLCMGAMKYDRYKFYKSIEHKNMQRQDQRSEQEVWTDICATNGDGFVKSVELVLAVFGREQWHEVEDKIDLDEVPNGDEEV